MQVGDFKNLEDWTSYLYNLRLQLETLASGHIRWYTHKNPYGCWICDLLLLIDKWEDIYYPKSVKKVMNKAKDDTTKRGKTGVIKSVE